MERLHFSIFINAPREKVWKTMLEKPTYNEWTEAFGPGGDYRGEWKEGSKMEFVAPGEKGEMGMVARIKEIRPYEFVSINHYGMIMDGVEDTTSEKVKAWGDAFENYTLNEKDGGTELLIDLDTPLEYKDMFEDLWPKALLKLKELAEK